MYWRKKPIVHSKVEARRKVCKLTQADVARLCSVTRQTIIAVEKGNYVPSVALALCLAKALETSVEELFTLEDEV